MREFLNQKFNPRNYADRTYRPSFQRPEYPGENRFSGWKRKLLSKKIIIFLILAAVVFSIVYWIKKDNPDDPENQVSVYEALIMTQDEAPNDKNSPSALRPGDVMVIFPEGHSWSETEKISYLLLKLKLKKSDADKLVMPETKKVKKTEKTPEGEPTGPEEPASPADMEETVKARQYRIKIEKLDFDPKMIWKNGQPYPDKIFDEGMIEEK